MYYLNAFNYQRLKNKSMPALLALQLGILPLAAHAMFFQDVQGNWAQHAIQHLSQEGIITGYPDGTFHPQGNVTRAEFSVMLMKAMGLKSKSPDRPSFSDVPSDNWAYTAIETVHAAGLVSGYPNGAFMPMKRISRAEVMATFANVAPNSSTSGDGNLQVLNHYDDASTIPNWARSSVASTIQSGVFANNPDNGNNIEPLQPATRADVAAMVENLRNELNLTGTAHDFHNRDRDHDHDLANESGGYHDQHTLQGHVAVIPADTHFTATLTDTTISSELNQVGDKVRLTVDQPLVSADNQVVVPVGSEIDGRISQIQPAGHVEKAGVVDISFYRIKTTDGQSYDIQGSVATQDGELHGSDTKGRVIKAAESTAIGAGLGAVLGTAMGPLSGGHVGRGAIYGTAVGAGAGALAVGVEKGKPVTLKSGDQLQIKLDRPLSVN